MDTGEIEQGDDWEEDSRELWVDETLAAAVAGRKPKELKYLELNLEDRKKFDEAILKDWAEHVSTGALELLDLNEAQKVIDNKRELILAAPARFVLCWKDASATGSSAGSMRAKARLVLPGYLDPQKNATSNFCTSLTCYLYAPNVCNCGGKILVDYGL